MLLKDPIYGKCEITESVLIELIKSKPVQRLQGLAQFGLPDQYYHVKGFNRFEHTLGVLILLRKFGADLEEQIAGLIHDVSHTAFSHVYDALIGNSEREDFQDRILEDFVRRSEIAEILSKYQIKLEHIFPIEKFSLLEQPIPDLCADRLDYTLREFYSWYDPSLSSLWRDLTVYEGQFVFSKIESARKFAEGYKALNEKNWASQEGLARYQIFSDLLGYALERKIIEEHDFWRDDTYILNKLQNSGDEYILRTLNELEQGSFKIKIRLKKKQRRIDPKVLVEGRAIRLSELRF